MHKQRLEAVAVEIVENFMDLDLGKYSGRALEFELSRQESERLFNWRRWPTWFRRLWENAQYHPNVDDEADLKRERAKIAAERIRSFIECNGLEAN